MKRLLLKPDGFKCTLEECKPGLFLSGNNLCFKTEYRTEPSGRVEAYNGAGEFYCGEGLVQPLVEEWDEYEIN